jgi:EpsI family protein
MTYKHVIIVSTIMILTMISVGYFSNSKDIKPNKPFSTFPEKIGEWEGTEEHFEKAVYEMLKVDDSYLANYHAPDGGAVQLYVGYYKSQKTGAQIHSPKNCLPGGGWNIIGSSLEDVELKGSTQNKIRVVKLLIENGGRKQVVFYWYQSNGKYISSEYKQKLYMIIDSITKHRTDAAFIRLIAPISDNNNDEITIKMLKDFAAELIPILNEYIPS